MTSYFEFEIKNALGLKGQSLVNEGDRIMRCRFLSTLKFFFLHRALQPSAGEPPASVATGGKRAFRLDCEYNAEYRLVSERF